MHITAPKDVICKKCGQVIRAGQGCGRTSGMRYYHDGICPKAVPAAVAPSPRPVHVPLDSYEQECEDEGIRMRDRYGRPSSY